MRVITTKITHRIQNEYTPEVYPRLGSVFINTELTEGIYADFYNAVGRSLSSIIRSIDNAGGIISLKLGEHNRTEFTIEIEGNITHDVKYKVSEAIYIHLIEVNALSRTISYIPPLVMRRLTQSASKCGVVHSYCNVATVFDFDKYALTTE